MQNKCKVLGNSSIKEMPARESIANLRIRQGEIHDADALAELFRITYGRTTHPCQSPAHIRASIASGRDSWFVADVGHSTAACLCVARHAWNRSWEPRYTVVHPQFRESGLCLNLLRIGLKNQSPQPVELGFCTTRTTTAHRVLARAADPVLVGHDGGPNLVNGLREYHMTAIIRPVVRGFAHVAPLNEAVLQSSFIRDRLYAPLGLRPTAGAYPGVYLTGILGSGREPLFLYSRDDVADAITLTAYVGPGESEAKVGVDLEAFVARHRELAYQGTSVLSDKAQLIRSMLERGFVITAYVLAWHLHGNTRYDCVTLVRCNFSQTPETHGFEADIETMDQAYSQLARAILRASNPPRADDFPCQKRQTSRHRGLIA